MIYDYEFFKHFPLIPSSQEILEKCFKSAKKAVKGLKGEKREKIFIGVFSSVLGDVLENILQQFPDFKEISPFYKELIEVKFPLRAIKRSLKKIRFVKKKVREIKNEALKGFLGRTCDLMRTISKDIDFLNNVIAYFHDFPNLKYLPTIALSGYPNVGKSSFLKKFTGAKVEVKNYPFTTKRLQISYLEEFPLQLVDAPGMLDRDFENMNFIEKLGYLIIKHATEVFFIFDASMEYDVQLSLLKRVLRIKPSYVIINKMDLNPDFRFEYKSERIKGVYYISLEKNLNLEAVYKLMKDIFYSSYKQYKETSKD
ncbi:MAG: GTPase [Candidatus Woesearchaeota archaeon]